MKFNPFGNKIKDEIITNLRGNMIQPTRLIIYKVLDENKTKIFNFYIPVFDAMANEKLDFETLAKETIKYYIESKKINTANEFNLQFRSNRSGFEFIPFN